MGQILLNLHATFGIRICLASRPEVQFEHIFHDLPRLTIQQHNHEGVSAYIKHAFDLALVSDIQSRTLLTGTLRSALADRAHDVMIWLRWAVDAIIAAVRSGGATTIDALHHHETPSRDGANTSNMNEKQNRGRIKG